MIVNDILMMVIGGYIMLLKHWWMMVNAGDGSGSIKGSGDGDDNQQGE